jgi:hypothetical protein
MDFARLDKTPIELPTASDRESIMTLQKEITLLPPARAEDYDNIKYLNQLFFGPDSMIACPGHGQMLENITPFIPPANGQDPIDYLGTVKYINKDGQLDWLHINNSSNDKDYSNSNMANPLLARFKAESSEDKGHIMLPNVPLTACLGKRPAQGERSARGYPASPPPRKRHIKKKHIEAYKGDSQAETPVSLGDEDEAAPGATIEDNIVSAYLYTAPSFAVQTLANAPPLAAELHVLSARSYSDVNCLATQLYSLCVHSCNTAACTNCKGKANMSALNGKQWLVDSGASKHYTNTMDDYILYEPLSETFVSTANGKGKLHGVGTILVNMTRWPGDNNVIRLYPVHYASDLNMHLLSIGTLLNDGLLIGGGGDKISLFQPGHKDTPVFIASRGKTDTLFYIQVLQPERPD